MPDALSPGTVENNCFQASCENSLPTLPQTHLSFVNVTIV